MKRIHVLSAAVCLAALQSLAACREDDDKATSTSTATTSTGGGSGGGGGGDTAVVDAFDTTFSIACDGPNDEPTTGAAGTSTLERCVYARGDKTLALNFDNAHGKQNGVITIDVVDFHGTGTYTTSKVEGGTTVSMSTGPTQGATHESNPPGSFGAHACTVVVEATNLLEVEIPAKSAGHGYVAVTLDCPVIGGAAVGELTCQVTPSHFELAVASCDAIL